MKKGQITEGRIEHIVFPNKGIAITEQGERAIVKNTIPGQKVSFLVNKVKKGKAEGRLLEIIEKSPLETDAKCPHFGECGGCTYQSLPYEEQLKLKEGQVRKLMEDAIKDACEYEFLGIKGSPKQYAYRNKMEFSFGDAFKGGPLALGMHKRGSFYDILSVTECQIVDEDFRAILKATMEFFGERNIPFFHRLTHEGYLRHLLVRKAEKTQEILIDLVVTTQYEKLNVFECGKVKFDKLSDRKSEHRTDEEIKDDVCEADIVDKDDTIEIVCENNGISFLERDTQIETKILEDWKERLLSLPLKGTIKGILRTKNDSVADVVRNDGTDILYGQDYFYEELLGLKFKISPFSFFQTNSLGAEVLYETARAFILSDDADKLKEKVVYDLYSGTGTIAQMLASVSKEVVGVEIVEEAVEAAKENAKLNGLTNCKFLAGDVLKVLDTIEQKPDYIVLDPPRDGIHPKAIEKIIDYGVENMIYISCKPTSLARDLEIFLARGYQVKKICCVDMFPSTYHVETVCLLSRRK